MNPSMREIARRMDPLDPPTSLIELNKRHRWLNPNQSFRTIVDRHVSPKMIRFLSYNTYLMNVKEVSWVDSHAKKPAVDDRANELGPRLVQEQYDLMALCEVWGIDYERKVISAWGWPTNNKGFPIDTGRWASGPECNEPDPKINSGLIQVCANPGYSIVFTSTKEFSKLSGDDCFSHKGILLTRINVGLGVLEVYSTHLNAADDVSVHQSNLNDLQQFVGQTHVHGNVAIIAGDFNINARNLADPNHLVLTASMNAMGMQDIWHSHWGDQLGGGYSSTINAGGYTATKPADDDNAVQISQRMGVIGAPDIRDGRFCLEPAPDGQLEERMDYIFVESPTTAHTFNLDVTRIRRRPFKRVVSTEGMDYLSDHLGLDVTFIISPR